MRFKSLTLENYIGIYNGMKMNSIVINFDACVNRMIIIRGDNGSGKSTIFNALTVLPDNNSSFIPGMSAKKIVQIQDGQVVYEITFIHPIKNDGSRDTTKAYISKFVPGSRFIELNPNGNVTSFKDILYDELGLDPNFVALSQLSTEDKGLASKKPAERKRFVNSIMSSLEVYNDIYKKLLKQSSTMKSMVQSLSTRLGAVGSPEVLSANLQSIDRQIEDLNKHKSDIEKAIMKCNLDKESIDPDGSIQSKIASLDGAVKDARKKLDSINSKMNMPYFDVPGDLKVRQEMLANLDAKLFQANSTIASYKEEINELDDKIRKSTLQIAQRKENIRSLTDDESYDEISYNLANSETRLNEIQSEIPSDLGIELGSITKAEYITALETLKEIKDAVQAFKASCSSMDSMMQVLSDAKSNERLIPKRVDEYDAKIRNYLANAPKLNEFIVRCEAEIEKLKQLSSRPNSCLDDTCPFISDLIRIRDADIPGQRAQAVRDLQQLELCYEDAQLQMKIIEEYNRNVNYLNNLIRLISINGTILVRLPHGAIYKDKMSFISALINNQDFSYIDEIYKYIYLGNLYDEYIAEKKVFDALIVRKEQCESKSDVVAQISAEIEELEQEITTHRGKIEELRKLLSDTSQKAQTMSVVRDNLKQNVDLMISALEPWNILIEGQKTQKNMIDQATRLAECDGNIKAYAQQIAFYNSQIANLQNERDKINHSLRSIMDYQQELAELQKKFDLIEKLRFYSSPTSGIQLVFMEFYMGKIIGLANELLSLLFNGKYIIQPFIINESEFRIPCLGDGYINDDISSMSSAQVSMISMILGFALLHNSSTRYNILKLDEIDGPLDETNRILFTDLLNRIMDIMHTEQCILISHNSEIDLNQADVIVLKSENLSTNNIAGNVIWKY